MYTVTFLAWPPISTSKTFTDIKKTKPRQLANRLTHFTAHNLRHTTRIATVSARIPYACVVYYCPPKTDHVVQLSGCRPHRKLCRLDVLFSWFLHGFWAGVRANSLEIWTILHKGYLQNGGDADACLFREPEPRDFISAWKLVKLIRQN